MRTAICPYRTPLGLFSGQATPRLDERIVQALRVRHYSRTEQAYVPWIKRFIFFHGVRHPAGQGVAPARIGARLRGGPPCPKPSPQGAGGESATSLAIRLPGVYTLPRLADRPTGALAAARTCGVASVS